MVDYLVVPSSLVLLLAEMPEDDLEEMDEESNMGADSQACMNIGERVYCPDDSTVEHPQGESDVPEVKMVSTEDISNATSTSAPTSPARALVFEPLTTSPLAMASPLTRQGESTRSSNTSLVKSGATVESTSNSLLTSAEKVVAAEKPARRKRTRNFMIAGKSRDQLQRQRVRSKPAMVGSKRSSSKAD